MDNPPQFSSYLTHFPFAGQLSEKLQDTENEAMAKIVELEKQLMQRNKELDVIRVSGLGNPGWIQDSGRGDHGSGAGEFSWLPRIEPGADFRWNYLCVHSKDGLESFWMCQESLMEHSQWEFWRSQRVGESRIPQAGAALGTVQCNPLSGSVLTLQNEES